MKAKILTVGDERLREKARKVSDVAEVATVIERMREMSLEWENEHPHEMSAAMAAPQIGEGVRAVIIRDSADDKQNTNFIALINPEVIRAEGKTEEDYEGCLSVPEIYGLVERPTKVKIKALDEDGNEVRIKVEGGLARTLLHEIDHLNGVLFIDHIRGKKDKFFRLNSQGDLEPLEYAEVEKMGLWDEEDG